jgi:hypothetical protein
MTDRVPLSRTMPFARLITGGEDRVAIAEPIPEDIADYRGQSALAEVDATGTLSLMIQGKSYVSVDTGVASPDGSRIATVEAPSGGVCYTASGVLSLRYKDRDPAQKKAVPTDEPYTTAVLDTVNVITGMHWAGDDLVVVFGPKPNCHTLLATRYVAYRLTDGMWKHLATGVSDLGFGAKGRSYTLEVPDHPKATKAADTNPSATLVITSATGVRKKVADDVASFVLTPAEEAAGVAKARATPEPEAVARTTDHGKPVPTAYQDLARQIADALDAHDTTALEALCAKCDEWTRQQLTTEEGRAVLRRTMRTHPAIDKNSATFPGLAIKRCIDGPKPDEACTKEQIHDIGLLGLKAGFDVNILIGSPYLAQTANSVRFTLDDSGSARWTGRYSGRWTDPQLIITPQSLGTVRVGMTLAQAQTAAGATFDGEGDGVSYPTTLPDGYPHLYVQGDAVRCVGADGDSQAQKVFTSDGFTLGESTQRLLAVYGQQARYVPPPTEGGRTNYSGYVVTKPDGNLVFLLDPTEQNVIGIVGGPNVEPNSCPG